MPYGSEEPTKREMEVLRLICDGLTSREVAKELGSTFKTAASHRASLMAKAESQNVIELFRWAVNAGMFPWNSRSPRRARFGNCGEK